jgi:effector-binding domain-containing protein
MKKYVIAIFVLLLCSPALKNAEAGATLYQNVKVAIKEVEPFTYCSIPHQGPLGEMESSIQILIGNMSGQNIPPGGTLFAIFNSIPEEGKKSTLDWEVGFPITALVFPQPPLKKGQWEHNTVASAIHTGRVETLGEAVDSILEWMDKNGYIKDGPIACLFLNISSEEVIPSRLETEIWIACKSK